MVKRVEKAAPAVRKINKNPKVQDLMRTEIYKAAARAAEKNGFAVISMDDVARELGGSKGQVYYYFKSKDELLSSMSLYVHELSRQMLQPIINDKTLSPRAKLEKVTWNHVITLCTDWNLHRALWTNTWFASLDQKNFNKVVIIRRTYRKDVEQLISEINSAKKEKKSVIKLKARLIGSMLDGVAGWYRPEGTQTPEEIADTVVKVVLNIVTT
jgi:AcrR family transcriptional regulator